MNRAVHILIALILLVVASTTTVASADAFIARWFERTLTGEAWVMFVCLGLLALVLFRWAVVAWLRSRRAT